MAAVDKWRKVLNEGSFCKTLRENNAAESNRKLLNDAKSLLLVLDNDLFIWDNKSSHLIFYNLNNLTLETNSARHQILQCTDSPRFSVDGLVVNRSHTHIAMWGQLGITVMELPMKWGKFAEFQGGQDVVSSKCFSVGEHFFLGRQGVKLLQVLWHPGSPSDSHIVFLTSDNLISIYDIQDPERAVQTIYLGDGNEPQYGASIIRPSISSALGDNVVSFDFGQSVEILRKPQTYLNGQQRTSAVWPIYCLRGNGDVLVAYSDLSQRYTKLPIQGPLLMRPPAEDNYGTDACSILYLHTTPAVLVLATCDGRLHHCILLPRDLEETQQSESSYRSSVEDSASHQPEEQMLYVYETVELELSLTTPTFSGTPTPDEIFTCPIRILRDISSMERYHCAHAAGVHTVALPWIHNYQSFCSQDVDVLPEHQDSIVEHLICTKPLVSSPPSPILGLAVFRDTSIGSVILTLSSDYEFYCIRLSDTRPVVSESALMSSSRSKSIPSPLRKITREKFDDRIRKILQRSTSNPLLKSKSNTDLSQQECYQLLSRATQVFREEYIQKQDLARQEIERRVKILNEQKHQQENDLRRQEETRNILTHSAEQLANLCEDCKEKQEELVKRIESAMRKLQSRIPFLSEAERNMKKELETMEERLEIYQRNVQQLRVKKDYQQRQIKQSAKTQQLSPVIRQNQNKQLRQVLKQEGDEIAELVNTVKSLQVDSGA